MVYFYIDANGGLYLRKPLTAPDVPGQFSVRFYWKKNNICPIKRLIGIVLSMNFIVICNFHVTIIMSKSKNKQMWKRKSDSAINYVPKLLQF